jgi:hypothetical protein
MKIVCQLCGDKGYLQHIGKNYYRIRYYIGLDSVSKKPRFLYHKQSLSYVQSLLRQNNSSPIDPIGQKNIDPHLLNNGSFTENNCASIAQSVEQQPCKHTEVNVDWAQYKVFLFSKYRHQYANMQFNNVRKNLDCMANPSKLYLSLHQPELMY